MQGNLNLNVTKLNLTKFKEKKKCVILCDFFYNKYQNRTLLVKSHIEIHTKSDHIVVELGIYWYCKIAFDKRVKVMFELYALLIKLIHYKTYLIFNTIYVLIMKKVFFNLNVCSFWFHVFELLFVCSNFNH